MLLPLNSACQNGPGATGGERLVPGLRERNYHGQQRSAHNNNDAEKFVFSHKNLQGLGPKPIEKQKIEARPLKIISVIWDCFFN